MGVWDDRWAHASLQTMRYEFYRLPDLLYARTREELRWVNAFEGFIQLILDDDLVFALVEDVVGPRVLTDSDKNMELS